MELQGKANFFKHVIKWYLFLWTSRFPNGYLVLNALEIISASIEIFSNNFIKLPFNDLSIESIMCST